MLIISDFDGTVTASDTNSYLAERFCPEIYQAVGSRLMVGELTIRDVLQMEVEATFVDLDEVTAVASEVPIRKGFCEFVDLVEELGHDFLVISSGFLQIINPILERAGFTERFPVLANDVEFSKDGGVATWRNLPQCELCGEWCKRFDLQNLRKHDKELIFIGDGLSDRCGAESADRIFARASLATYLDEKGVEYEYFDTFNDISKALFQDA